MGAEDSANAVPAEAIELMKQCWREMPFERNNMSDTVQALEDMNPDRLMFSRLKYLSRASFFWNLDNFVNFMVSN